MAGRPIGTCTGAARELQPSEIQALTKRIRGLHRLRDAAMVHLMLGAGLRVSEACHLRVGDVHGGTLVVQSHKAKTRRSRRVYLSQTAQEHLRLYLADRGPALAGEPLFPSQKGGHMHPNYGVRLIARLLRQAGIAGASSHSMRRSHANALWRGGADILVVQAQLGHASLQSTQIYLASNPAAQASAVAALRF